jgi:hypothetical protein
MSRMPRRSTTARSPRTVFAAGGSQAEPHFATPSPGHALRDRSRAGPSPSSSRLSAGSGAPGSGLSAFLGAGSRSHKVASRRVSGGGAATAHASDTPKQQSPHWDALHTELTEAREHHESTSASAERMAGLGAELCRDSAAALTAMHQEADAYVQHVARHHEQLAAHADAARDESGLLGAPARLRGAVQGLLAAAHMSKASPRRGGGGDSIGTNTLAERCDAAATDLQAVVDTHGASTQHMVESVSVAARSLGSSLAALSAHVTQGDEVLGRGADSAFRGTTQAEAALTDDQTAATRSVDAAAKRISGGLGAQRRALVQHLGGMQALHESLEESFSAHETAEGGLLGRLRQAEKVLTAEASALHGALGTVWDPQAAATTARELARIDEHFLEGELQAIGEAVAAGADSCLALLCKQADGLRAAAAAAHDEAESSEQATGGSGTAEAELLRTLQEQASALPVCLNTELLPALVEQRRMLDGCAAALRRDISQASGAAHEAQEVAAARAQQLHAQQTALDGVAGTLHAATADEEQLLRALREGAQQRRAVDGELTQLLREQGTRIDSSGRTLDSWAQALESQEQEVVRAVMQGLAHRGIEDLLEEQMARLKLASTETLESLSEDNRALSAANAALLAQLEQAGAQSQATVAQHAKLCSAWGERVGGCAAAVDGAGKGVRKLAAELETPQPWMAALARADGGEPPQAAAEIQQMMEANASLGKQLQGLVAEQTTRCAAAQHTAQRWGSAQRAVAAALRETAQAALAVNGKLQAELSPGQGLLLRSDSAQAAAARQAQAASAAARRVGDRLARVDAAAGRVSAQGEALRSTLTAELAACQEQCDGLGLDTATQQLQEELTALRTAAESTAAELEVMQGATEADLSEVGVTLEEWGARVRADLQSIGACVREEIQLPRSAVLAKLSEGQAAVTQLADVIASAVGSEAEQQHQRLSDSIKAHQLTWAEFGQGYSEWQAAREKAHSEAMTAVQEAVEAGGTEVLAVVDVHAEQLDMHINSAVELADALAEAGGSHADVLAAHGADAAALSERFNRAHAAEEEAMLAAASATAQVLAASHAATGTRRAALEAAATQYQEAYRALEHRHEELSALAQELEASLVSKEDECEALSTQLQVRGTELESMEASADDLTAQVAALSAQCAAHKDTAGEAQEAHTAVARQLVAQANEHAAKDAEHTAHRERLQTELDETHLTFRAQTEQMKVAHATAHEQMEEALAQAQQRHADAAAAHAAATQEHEGWVMRQRTETAGHAGTIAELRAAAEATEATHEKRLAEKSDLHGALAAQLAAAEAERDGARAIHDAAMEAQEQELARLREASQSQLSSIASLRVQVDAQPHELELLASQHATALTQLRVEHSGVHAEHDRVRGRLQTELTGVRAAAEAEARARAEAEAALPRATELQTAEHERAVLALQHQHEAALTQAQAEHAESRAAHEARHAEHQAQITVLQREAADTVDVAEQLTAQHNARLAEHAKVIAAHEEQYAAHAAERERLQREMTTTTEDLHALRIGEASLAAEHVAAQEEHSAQVKALKDTHTAEVGRLRAETEQHADTISALRSDAVALATQHAERSDEHARLLEAQQAQLVELAAQKAELLSTHAAAVAGHEEHAGRLRESGEAAASELAELRAAHARHGPSMALAAAEHATEVAKLRHALDAAEAQAAAQTQTQQRALEQMEESQSSVLAQLRAESAAMEIEHEAAHVRAKTAHSTELERVAAQHATQKQEMERSLENIAEDHAGTLEEHMAAHEQHAKQVRQHEETISELRQAAAQTATLHEQRVEAHSEQVAAYEDRIGKLHSEHSDALAMALNEAHERHADQVRQHEGTISALRQTATEMTAQHERHLGAHSDRVAAYEDRLSKLRSEHSKELGETQAAHEQESKRLQDSHTQVLEGAAREHVGTVHELQTAISALRAKDTNATETMDVLKSAHAQELTKLEAQCAADCTAAAAEAAAKATQAAHREAAATHAEAVLAAASAAKAQLEAVKEESRQEQQNLDDSHAATVAAHEEEIVRLRAGTVNMELEISQLSESHDADGKERVQQHDAECQRLQAELQKALALHQEARSAATEMETALADKEAERLAALADKAATQAALDKRNLEDATLNATNTEQLRQIDELSQECTSLAAELQRKKGGEDERWKAATQAALDKRNLEDATLNATNTEQLRQIDELSQECTSLAAELQRKKGGEDERWAAKLTRSEQARDKALAEVERLEQALAEAKSTTQQQQQQQQQRLTKSEVEQPVEPEERDASPKHAGAVTKPSAQALGPAIGFGCFLRHWQDEDTAVESSGVRYSRAYIALSALQLRYYASKRDFEECRQPRGCVALADVMHFRALSTSSLALRCQRDQRTVQTLILQEETPDKNDECATELSVSATAALTAALTRAGVRLHTTALPDQSRGDVSIPDTVQAAMLRVLWEAIHYRSRTLYGRRCTDLRSFFDAADEGRSGLISRTQLRKALAQLDVGLTSLQLERLVATLEPRGESQLVGPPELERWMLRGTDQKVQADAAGLPSHTEIVECQYDEAGAWHVVVLELAGTTLSSIDIATLDPDRGAHVHGANVSNCRVQPRQHQGTAHPHSFLLVLASPDSAGAHTYSLSLPSAASLEAWQMSLLAPQNSRDQEMAAYNPQQLGSNVSGHTVGPKIEQTRRASPDMVASSADAVAQQLYALHHAMSELRRSRGELNDELPQAGPAEQEQQGALPSTPPRRVATAAASAASRSARPPASPYNRERDPISGRWSEDGPGAVPSDQPSEPSQLFEVTQDYLLDAQTQPRSVVLRVGVLGLSFFDDRATMMPLGTLQYSAILSWVLQSSSVLEVTMQTAGREKMLTIRGEALDQLARSMSYHSGLLQTANEIGLQPNVDGGMSSQTSYESAQDSSSALTVGEAYDYSASSSQRHEATRHSDDPLHLVMQALWRAIHHRRRLFGRETYDLRSFFRAVDDDGSRIVTRSELRRCAIFSVLATRVKQLPEIHS